MQLVQQLSSQSTEFRTELYPVKQESTSVNFLYVSPFAAHLIRSLDSKVFAPKAYVCITRDFIAEVRNAPNRAPAFREKLKLKLVIEDTKTRFMHL